MLLQPRDISFGLEHILIDNECYAEAGTCNSPLCLSSGSGEGWRPRNSTNTWMQQRFSILWTSDKTCLESDVAINQDKAIQILIPFGDRKRKQKIIS